MSGTKGSIGARVLLEAQAIANIETMVGKFNISLSSRPKSVAPVEIVRVKPGDELSGAVRHARVDRVRLASVFLALPVFEPRRPSLDDGYAIIGGTPVHHYYFKIGIF